MLSPTRMHYAMRDNSSSRHAFGGSAIATALSQAKGLAAAYGSSTTTAVLAALSLTIGIVCNGFDNGFGNPIGLIVNALLLLYLLSLSAPAMSFWIWTGPVIATTLAGAIWLALPLTSAGRQMGALPLAPDLALSQFLGLAAALIALLSGCLFGIRHGRAAVIDWLLAFMAADFLVGLFIWHGDFEGASELWSMGRHGRFAATLGNSNVAAAVSGSVAVLALARALSTDRDRKRRTNPRRAVAWRVFHWLVLLLALGACAATASRAAMALTLAAMLVLGGRTVLFSRVRGRAMLVFAATAIVVATILLAGYSDQLMERSRALSADSLDRLAMWTHAADLVWASPLFGYGTGSFPVLNLYALADPRMAGAMWTINSPHCILLRLALDGGLPYLVLVLCGVAWVGVSCLLAFGPRRWDTLSIGLALAVGVIIGCAMVDIALDVPAVSTLMLFLVGLIWGRARSFSLSL